MVAWDKKNDGAKLFNLFKKRDDRGGLDFRRRDKEYIEAARVKHFPKMKSKNFAITYNKKPSKVDIDEKLKASRARKDKLFCLCPFKRFVIYFSLPKFCKMVFQSHTTTNKRSLTMQLATKVMWSLTPTMTSVTTSLIMEVMKGRMTYPVGSRI